MPLPETIPTAYVTIAVSGLLTALGFMAKAYLKEKREHREDSKAAMTTTVSLAQDTAKTNEHLSQVVGGIADCVEVTARDVAVIKDRLERPAPPAASVQSIVRTGP